MAYETFIPEVWVDSINKSLARNCVMVEDCTREYEGKAKQIGDTVHILTTGKPTIYEISRAEAGNEIEAAETVDGTDTTLVLEKMAYYNFKINDIDKAQALDGVMQAITDEASEGMANKIDQYVANFAIRTKTVSDETVKMVKNLYESPIVLSSSKSAAGYILKVLDNALEQLYLKDVSPSTEVVATLSTRAWFLFKEAYLDRLSNNNELMKNGNVAKYGGITVKMSNNVAKSASSSSAPTTFDVDNMLIRTKRAMAFVNPFTHAEPYRPEKEFSDALKGYTVYGAKVLRPDEIFNINGKYA